MRSARGLWPGISFFPCKLNRTEPEKQQLRVAEYRKIPKISPGAYIFQRPFLRGLFLEGFIFGGAI